MLLRARTVDFLTRTSADVSFVAIVLSAVIGSLCDPLPSNRTIILTIFFSLQVISWGRAYAGKIAEDMAAHRVAPWAAHWSRLLTPNWMMVTTAVPIACFGMAELGVMSQSDALLASECTLLSILMLSGFISRRVSGGGVMRSLLTGASVVVLGYVAIEIKLWAKHLPSSAHDAASVVASNLQSRIY